MQTFGLEIKSFFSNVFNSFYSEWRIPILYFQFGFFMGLFFYQCPFQAWTTDIWSYCNLVKDSISLKKEKNIYLVSFCFVEVSQSFNDQVKILFYLERRERQRERETETERDRERQTDRETDRQADRQADRQTDRGRERDREMLLGLTGME